MGKNSYNKILIRIIVFLILLLIVGGGSAVWYVTRAPENPEPIQITKKKSKDSADENLAEVGPLYPLKPITVNLETVDKKDVYLKTTLSLELSSKELSNELEARNAVIRDEIIRILSSKTPVNIDSEFKKDKLCTEIKTSLNMMLTDGQIRNVYIINFIIQ